MPFISYAQNFEDVMLWRALKHIEKGFYIDVGANDPERDSVTRAFYERGWRGINIEPVKADFDRFVARRPDDINLQVAVGELPGAVPLYVFAGTGLTTIQRVFADKHAAAGRAFHEQIVPVRTLAEICAEHAPADIHFLKIDVEGAERDVLAGADFARFRPWIILAEATIPNSQEKNHQEWEPILSAAGYRFVWFDGLNRFYLAAEHVETLASSFEAPPNVFDDFTCRRIIDVPRSPPAPMPVILDVPEQVSVDERVRMTAHCRDGDAIPRVPGAGKVLSEADGTRVQIMHNGVKVLADGYCGAWMTGLIELCRGLHEPQEERIFHEVVSRLGPGGTMIELGGYWAFYSLWYLMSEADRRAIVVEPEPAHLAVGKRNAALNGLRAEFLSGYVGDAAPYLASEPNQSAAKPNRVTVSDLMAAHGIDSLEILHCDTQGAELSVLEECLSLIRAGRIRWIFVSTHARQICGDPLMHQRCLALLRRAGCVIEADHDVHESFSGDGLIVARSGPPPANWVPVELSRNRYSESLFRNPLYDLAALLRSSEGEPAIIRRERAEAIVQALYRILLLREAEPGGLERWTRILLETNDTVALAARMMGSKEFDTKLPTFFQQYGINAKSL